MFQPLGDDGDLLEVVQRVVQLHIPDIDHHREEVFFNPLQEDPRHLGKHFPGRFVLPVEGLLKPRRAAGKDLSVVFSQAGGGRRLGYDGRRLVQRRRES